MPEETQKESGSRSGFNHRDLAAYALLFCIMFVAISLATYDAADAIGPLIAPLDQLYQQDLVIAPPNDEIQNQCGWWGALIADVMFSTLGVGAILIVAGLTYVDFQLLRRRPLDTLLFRVLGATLTTIGITGFATLAFPDWSPGPVLGSGGALGATVGWCLERHFATTGGIILCMSCMIAGLLIATDYAVYRAASMAGGAFANTAAAGRGLFGRKKLNRLASDVEDAFADGVPGASSDNVSIKIRGNTVSDDEVLEDEDEGEWEDEGWEDDAEDAEAVEEAEDEADAYEEEEAEEEIVVKTPRPKGRREEEQPSERDQVFAELNDVDFEEDDDYELPELELLVAGDEISYDAQRKELAHKAKLLEKTFKDFGLNVRVVEIETGPVIAQYEIELEPGLRLSKITNLADDIAIALRVPSVRIVSPIPGKNTVGIEVPNAKRQMVRLRDVIEETNGKAKKMKIPIFLGQDVSGNPMTADLVSLPHLLIAGRTGTGKSVCLNAIITSILMTKRPDEVRMLMIDPKMVELSGYGRLPHLMHPVVTDMKKAEAILAWAVDKMEERYSLLARAGVRHITSYNQLGDEELMDRLGAETDEEREEVPQHLPFIVIIADEMADLMMTAGKEVEQHIIRLAQKSRAVGIHLILATQKPTVDVITGLIKSNLPARISFQVASRTDSRVVLDEMGAEKLLGNGDMLFLWPGTSTLLRGQGTYLGDDEIDRVVDAASTGEQNFVNELVNMNVSDIDGEDRMEELRKRDDLYESAIEVVVREQRGSCSLLQRALGIGYGRAARLIDFMAEDGIVGSYAGSQARDVMLTMDDWESMQGMESGGGDDPKPPSGPGPSSPKREDQPKAKPTLKSRADSASKPKPQRITAEAAASSSPKPKRRNKIVLSDDEHLDSDDEELAPTDDEDASTPADAPVALLDAPRIKSARSDRGAPRNEADAVGSGQEDNTVIDIELLASSASDGESYVDEEEGAPQRDAPSRAAVVGLDEEDEENEEEYEAWEEGLDAEEDEHLNSDESAAEEDDEDGYEYEEEYEAEEYEEEDEQEAAEGESVEVCSEDEEDDEEEEDEYEYDESAYLDECEYEEEEEDEEDDIDDSAEGAEDEYDEYEEEDEAA